MKTNAFKALSLALLVAGSHVCAMDSSAPLVERTVRAGLDPVLNAAGRVFSGFGHVTTHETGRFIAGAMGTFCLVRSIENVGSRAFGWVDAQAPAVPGVGTARGYVSAQTSWLRAGGSAVVADLSVFEGRLGELENTVNGTPAIDAVTNEDGSEASPAVDAVPGVLARLEELEAGGNPTAVENLAGRVEALEEVVNAADGGRLVTDDELNTALTGALAEVASKDDVAGILDAIAALSTDGGASNEE